MEYSSRICKGRERNGRMPLVAIRKGGLEESNVKTGERKFYQRFIKIG